MHLLGFLLAATAAAPTPTVAIAPPVPVPADPETAWIGMVLADELSDRLLSHAIPDPSLGQLVYPFSVFGWRQALAAAEAEGIDTTVPLSQAAAAELAMQLGTDMIFVARYTTNGDQLDLAWMLAGAPGAQAQQTSMAVADLAAGASSVFEGLLQATGSGGTSVRPMPATPRPLETIRSYGKALVITSQQSLDPRAQVVLSADELTQAERLLGDVVTRSPEFAGGWVLKGVTSAMQGLPARAEEELVQGMAQAGGFSPTVALGLFSFYYRQGKTDDGVGVLAEATQTNPGFLHGLGYLGQAYLETKKPEQAARVFESYLGRAPRNPWAAVKHADALARMGKMQEAIAATKKVLAAMPDSVMVSTELASRYIDAGEFDAAAGVLESSLQRQPEHPALLTRLAYVELRQGRAQQALMHAKTAVGALGRGRGVNLAGYAYVNLGHALALAGRTEAAYGALRRAQKLGATVTENAWLMQDPKLAAFRDDAQFPFSIAAKK